jgi:hypothetical protein
MRASQVRVRGSQDQKFSSVRSGVLARGTRGAPLEVMRITSVLFALGILGSSSLALADTPNRWQRRDAQDHRFHDYSRDRPSTWQPLTPQQRLERGGDVFDVRFRHRFQQVRLQNQTGRTFVRSIEVVFANGRRQRIDVGRMLEGNHDMVTVDLPGDTRRIDRIIVEGRSRRSGSYQLYAM